MAYAERVYIKIESPRCFVGGRLLEAEEFKRLLSMTKHDNPRDDIFIPMTYMGVNVSACQFESSDLTSSMGMA